MSDATYVQASNEIVSLALDEAKLILRFGPAQQKIQVIRSVLGVIARTAAAGQDAAANEMRIKMEALMSSMRDVPMLDQIVREGDFIEAEVVSEE